jgi:hypothetical protein
MRPSDIAAFIQEKSLAYLHEYVWNQDERQVRFAQLPADVKEQYFDHVRLRVCGSVSHTKIPA